MTKPRKLSTFRIHLILTVAIVTLGFAVVIGLALFVPLATQLGRPDLDAETMGGIARHALDMHLAFWPVVMLSVAASAGTGFLLYQRMTGPLFRFVAAFRGVVRGEQPRPIVIRKVDYLHPETEALNEMLIYLDERARTISAAARDIDRIADDLLSTSNLGPEELDLARELRDVAKALG